MYDNDCICRDYLNILTKLIVLRGSWTLGILLVKTVHVHKPS